MFEGYDDVTEFLRSIEHTERNISIGIATGLAILYMLLIVVMRQSEKVVTTHHDKDQQMLAEMKTVAEMLELRVAERTDALRRREEQFKQAARTATSGTEPVTRPRDFMSTSRRGMRVLTVTLLTK